MLRGIKPQARNAALTGVNSRAGGLK